MRPGYRMALGAKELIHVLQSCRTDPRGGCAFDDLEQTLAFRVWASAAATTLGGSRSAAAASGCGVRSGGCVFRSGHTAIAAIACASDPAWRSLRVVAGGRGKRAPLPPRRERSRQRGILSSHVNPVLTRLQYFNGFCSACSSTRLRQTARRGTSPIIKEMGVGQGTDDLVK